MRAGAYINRRRAQNIIGFLSRQNFEFDRATENLTEVKTMLAGARYVPVCRSWRGELNSRCCRIRNYDLPTAITVLTTGTYTGLPSIFSENFAQPTTLSDEVVLKTLDELDDVLRWRLTCVEVLPRGMRRYWIGELPLAWSGRRWNGKGERRRLTHDVRISRRAGHFPGRGTLGSELHVWGCIRRRFGRMVPSLRQILVSRQGCSRRCGFDSSISFRHAHVSSLCPNFITVWSSVPMGPMKDHIVELCNRELAKRRPPEGGDGEAAGAEERDAPLVRGYEFLRESTTASLHPYFRAY